jgi:hypothetical protein
MSAEAADLGASLQATIALIAIANPFAALPVFLSLVPSGDAAGQRLPDRLYTWNAGGIVLQCTPVRFFGDTSG